MMMLHPKTFSPNRILVVRSLPGLGDLLCGVPALRALRLAFPTAHISFLGLPERRWFGDRFSHLIDDWLDFPGYPGIPEGWQGARGIPRFLMRQQEQPYDLALQLHGNGCYTNPLVTLLGAKTTAGFFVPGQFCPDPRYFLPYPDTEPEIWRLLRLLEFLQIPLRGDHLEFPTHSRDQKVYRQQTEIYGLQAGSYVCIHPGASGGDRRWSTSGFAAVGDALTVQGYTVVLTGTTAERPLTDAVAERMVSKSVNLAGYTELGTLALLLQRSALLVCNDTGISHLASATDTPSVVVFSNSEPHCWAPLNRDRHRVVDIRTRKIDPVKAVLLQANFLLTKDSTPSNVVDGEVAYAQ
jgi:ADP-heptose:LPS heptosyltransferase